MMMRYFQILTLVLAAAFGHQAEAREFSIPEYQANPGGHVDVPMMLNDASGLCMVNFQVNYDASILQLVSVTRGTLGQSFSEFSSNEEAGVIRTTLANETDLASGEGALVIMRFNFLNGADNTVLADVSLASYDYADSSGIVALSQEEAATAISGQVQAVNDPNIDNFGNQLPDWWEDLYGLNKFSLQTASSDEDQDGASALLEYGLNGNPGQADASALFSHSQKPENPSVIQLSLQLRSNDSSLTYLLNTSQNLSDWNQYPITWNGSAWTLDNPAGISIGESVYEGEDIWSLKLEQATDEVSKRFFRVGVDR